MAPGCRKKNKLIFRECAGVPGEGLFAADGHSGCFSYNYARIDAGK